MPASPTASFAHLVWLFFGPLCLMSLLQGIGRSPSWFRGLDCAYFGIVALMLLARWFDQRSGHCVRLTGEAATWKHFRQYALGLPAVAAVVWMVVKLNVAASTGW